MIVFLVFLIAIALTVAHAPGLAALGRKTKEEWILDLAGLFMQGVLIPVLQITVLYYLYLYFLPLQQGRFNLHPFVAFSLSFICVDYLYYWNHRLLHTQGFWPCHLVHHTVTEMDVLGTSRNTLWTSFLIVYLWIHALAIYLLRDPSWYVLGVSLTSALDLWRHSQFGPVEGSWLYRLLNPWLNLPQDHAWHHAEIAGYNFGANFKLWDKIHGTYYSNNSLPDRLGIKTDFTLAQKLIWPYFDS